MFDFLTPELISNAGILTAYIIQTIIFILYIHNKDKQGNESIQKSEERFAAIARQSIETVKNNTVALSELNATNRELRNDVQKLDRQIFELEKKIS